ncbi:olfactory receptor 10J3-like [Engraulis encrasicolus]|uniref:olfactory receptor 10J3-like n=1 Tax=Engraulis encrasicolus TaxID=184585 RepID=UPI002FCFB34A
MEQDKYLYFTLFLLLYVLTITVNTALIGAICRDRFLHEPMYIFICNLSVNAIYGSTALLPHVMSKLISQSYNISLAECAAQIFCLHTFAINDLMILSIMGYDRYAAICNPLHYHYKMSPSKVKFLLIVFSYVQILRVCLRASNECKKKAFQTCLPHLVTVIIYSIGLCFEIILGRLEKNAVPHGVKVFMSLYFLIMSPLLNPVVYGAGVLKIYINVKVSPQR